MKSNSPPPPSTAAWFDHLEKTLLEIKTSAHQNRAAFASFRTYIEGLCRRTALLKTTVSTLVDREASLLSKLQERDSKLQKLTNRSSDAGLEDINQIIQSIETNQQLKRKVADTRSRITQDEDRLKAVAKERDHYKAQLNAVASVRSTPSKLIEADFINKGHTLQGLQNELKKTETPLALLLEKNRQLKQDLFNQDATLSKLKADIQNMTLALQAKKAKNKAVLDRITQLKDTARKTEEIKSLVAVTQKQLNQANTRAKHFEIKVKNQLEEIDRLRQVNSAVQSKSDLPDLPSIRESEKNEITQ